ncbi:MAG: addiction module protein [Verrucomicrobiales bacterium]|nr:addiction module protein [Verrucomicrobiales bacterium]
MVTLSDVQNQSDSLSQEDKAGLITHLLASLSSPPPGPDDEEVQRRVEEMDSGEVAPISHEQFLAEVGRG